MCCSKIWALLSQNTSKLTLQMNIIINNCPPFTKPRPFGKNSEINPDYVMLSQLHRSTVFMMLILASGTVRYSLSVCTPSTLILQCPAMIGVFFLHIIVTVA